MKTWQIILISAVVLGLLAVRGIYLKFQDSQEAQLEYCRNLRYEFSARIDSVKRLGNGMAPVGFIYFSRTHGDFQRSREDSLRRKVKSGDVHTLVGGKNKSVNSIFLPEARLLKAGDSLVVSSSANTIHFFRGDSLVVQMELTKAVRKSEVR